MTALTLENVKCLTFFGIKVLRKAIRRRERETYVNGIARGRGRSYGHRKIKTAFDGLDFVAALIRSWRRIHDALAHMSY